MAKQFRPVPKLTPLQLSQAVVTLKQLPIDQRTRRTVEASLRAAANEKAEDPVELINAMQGEQRALVFETVKILDGLVTGQMKRARSALNDVSDDEWNAAVDAEPTA